MDCTIKRNSKLETVWVTGTTDDGRQYRVIIDHILVHRMIAKAARNTTNVSFSGPVTVKIVNTKKEHQS